jgi:molybdopterin molybdotransferase
LAEPVYSPVNTPPFDQSAMDGYAFSFEKWDGKSDLYVTGEVQAGNYFAGSLASNEAVRIYTGACLPPGSDTVVMQEKIIISGKRITITDKELIKGNNVRLQGSQSVKGDMALKAGVNLTPAGISFLAGMGIEEVKVFAKPIVHIIITGKELTKPGHPLTKGKIYESNSYGLIAALNQLDITPASLKILDDNKEEIYNAINNKVYPDILILTGGVSVGDYDFVLPALEKSGAKSLFHKIKQKPGKPFYFGMLEHTLVFALPGNPAAVLTCFYEYIVPAISQLTQKTYFKKIKLPLENDYTKKPGLTCFVKGKIADNRVIILNNQESYLMNSYAMADCIIELEENKEHFNKGDLVELHMII